MSPAEGRSSISAAICPISSSPSSRSPSKIPRFGRPRPTSASSSSAVAPRLSASSIVRQKPLGLERQESRGHDEEFAGSAQIPVGAHMSDELVCDLGQGQLGHIQPSARDEREKQVEGTLELGQTHGESGNLSCCARLRASSSAAGHSERSRGLGGIRLRRHCRGR